MPLYPTLMCGTRKMIEHPIRFCGTEGDHAQATQTAGQEKSTAKHFQRTVIHNLGKSRHINQPEFRQLDHGKSANVGIL